MKVMGARSLSSVVTALIEIGWYGSLALLVLAVCLLALAPWVKPPDLEVGLAVPAAFSVDARPQAVMPAPAAGENIHLDDARGSVRFSPRSPAVVAASALMVIAILALVAWGLGQLRAVFRTLRAGQPFVAANAARIRRIGYAVILGEVVRALLTYAGTRYAAAHFSLEGVRFEARPDLNVAAIVGGLIILVIAEVFREGTRLDEEQSLTV